VPVLTIVTFVEVTRNIHGVPFKHFVLCIPTKATAKEVFNRYQRLLQETQKSLKEAKQGNDYNVILTLDWIVLIPRSKAEWGGPFGANAQGMIGLVSVRDQEEKDRWTKLGWAAHLRDLGISIDS
jgi:ATP adenylyltransferase